MTRNLYPVPCRGPGMYGAGCASPARLHRLSDDACLCFDCHWRTSGQEGWAKQPPPPAPVKAKMAPPPAIAAPLAVSQGAAPLTVGEDVALPLVDAGPESFGGADFPAEFGPPTATCLRCLGTGLTDGGETICACAVGRGMLEKEAPRCAQTPRPEPFKSARASLRPPLALDGTIACLCWNGRGCHEMRCAHQMHSPPVCDAYRPRKTPMRERTRMIYAKGAAHRRSQGFVGTLGLETGLYQFRGSVYWPRKAVVFGEEEVLQIRESVTRLERVDREILILECDGAAFRAGAWIETPNGRRWAVPLVAWTQHSKEPKR